MILNTCEYQYHSRVIPKNTSSNLIPYNFSADLRIDEKRDALCIVSFDGNITWIPQGIYMSTCDIDVMTFPFDKQTCSLKFGSWAHDGTKLDFMFDGPERMEAEDYFVANKAWSLIDVPAKRNVLKYSCCPETYIDLTYTIEFRRSATFYTYILILPCVLLTSLTLVLYWIPPESPTKMALGKIHSIIVKLHPDYFIFCITCNIFHKSLTEMKLK